MGFLSKLSDDEAYTPVKELTDAEKLDVLADLQEGARPGTYTGLALGGLGGAALGALLAKKLGGDQSEALVPAIGATAGLTGMATGGILGHLLGKAHTVRKLKKKYKSDVSTWRALKNKEILLAALAGNDENELRRVQAATNKLRKEQLRRSLRLGVNYNI